MNSKFVSALTRIFAIQRRLSYSPFVNGTALNYNYPQYISSCLLCSRRGFHATTQVSEEKEPSFFGNLASRLKNIWNPKEQQAATTTSPSEATPPQQTPDPAQSEADTKEDELSDKGLLKAVEEGAFDLNSYHAEVKRLLRLQKVRNAAGSVKKVFTGSGKGEKDPAEDVVADLQIQLKMLEAMSPEERKQPNIFYDHAFKLKKRIADESGSDVAEVNRLIQKYEVSRVIYQVIYLAKKQGKTVPTKEDDLVKFVAENVELLNKKDRTVLMSRLAETMKGENSSLNNASSAYRRFFRGGR